VKLKPNHLSWTQSCKVDITLVQMLMGCQVTDKTEQKRTLQA